MTALSRGPVGCVPLGQAGFRLQMGDVTLYIDPYLSDSVAATEGERQHRVVPVWKTPELIDDARFVLITHAHQDHCDLETLAPMAAASPDCRFIGPGDVCARLAQHGFFRERLILAPDHWLDLGEGVRVHAVPAAHPSVECDDAGCWRCVGYVIEYAGRRIYHAGDTGVTAEVIDFVRQFAPLDVVMLPVNEHNYFRDCLGILGNMSVRDAFGFAELLRARQMVPMHWDMFKANTVYREEIELVYRLAEPPFELVINPDVL